MRVKALVSGNAAARAGLKLEDVIISANGVPCRHPETLVTYIDALARAATDESVVLQLLPRPGGPKAQPGYRQIKV